MSASLQAVVTLDKSQFEAGLSGMRKVVTQATSAMALAFGGVAGEIFTMGRAFGPVGAAVAVMKEAIKIGVAFESQMAQVASVTGLAGDEFVRVTELARTMATETSFTATQSAEALYALGSAGLSTADDLEGALEPTLKLAGATLSETSLAAEALTGSLNTFRLDASKTGAVADLFFGAIASSPANMTRLSEAMSQASSVAAAFGMNIEQTVESVAAFHKVGIMGGAAGTAFRQAMMALNKAANSSTSAIGQALRTWKPATEGMTGAIKRLEKAGIKGTDIMNEFGARGGKAVAAQLALGTTEINKMTNAIDENRNVNKGYMRQMDTMLGQWNLFKSSMQELALGLYDVLEPALRKIVSVVKAVSEGIRGLKERFDVVMSKDMPHASNVLVRTMMNMQMALHEIFKAIAKGIVDGLFGKGTTDTLVLKAKIGMVALIAVVEMKGYELVAVFAEIARQASAKMLLGMGNLAEKLNLDKLAHELRSAAGFANSFFAEFRDGSRQARNAVIGTADTMITKMEAQIVAVKKAAEANDDLSASFGGLGLAATQAGEGFEKAAEEMEELQDTALKFKEVDLEKLAKSATGMMTAASMANIKKVLQEDEVDAVKKKQEMVGPDGMQQMSPDISGLGETLTRIATSLESLVQMKGIIWA